MTLTPMWAQARDTDLSRNPQRFMSWADAQAAVAAGPDAIAQAVEHYTNMQGPNEPVVRYLDDALTTDPKPGTVTVFEFKPLVPAAA